MNIVKTVWVQNVKDLLLQSKFLPDRAIYFLFSELDRTFVNVYVPTLTILIFSERESLGIFLVSISQVEIGSWLDKLNGFIFMLVCWLKLDESTATKSLLMTKVHQTLRLL